MSQGVKKQRYPELELWNSFSESERERLRELFKELGLIG